MDQQKIITRRPVKPDDLEFIFQVYSSTREEELSVTGWDAESKVRFLRQQFNAQREYYQDQFTDATFDIVLEDNTPIGRLYVDRREDEIRIIDIALLPEQRGHGIGSALLAEILLEAKQRKIPARIHVEKFNRALQLYKRLGFRAVADRDPYLLMQWQAGERNPQVTPNSTKGKLSNQSDINI